MNSAGCSCLILCVLNLIVFASCGQQRVFLNHFAVHVPTGEADANDIAARHGFTNLGQVSKYITSLRKYILVVKYYHGK